MIDGEPRLICPYNEAHYILAKRFGTHLVKCRKDHPNFPLLQCHFDVNHRVAQPELQYHHTICPSRVNIEAVVYQEEGVDLSKFPINNVEVETEECWDNEYVDTYNPVEYCETREILRHKDVAPPSERKEFKSMERRRHIDMAPSNQSKNGNASTSSNSDPSLPGPSTSRPGTSKSTVSAERTAELLKKLNNP